MKNNKHGAYNTLKMTMINYSCHPTNLRKPLWMDVYNWYTTFQCVSTKEKYIYYKCTTGMHLSNVLRDNSITNAVQVRLFSINILMQATGNPKRFPLSRPLMRSSYMCIQIHFNSLQLIWYQLPTDSTCFSKWFAETAWFAQNQTWLFKSWLKSRCWEKSETLNPNPISWTRVTDVFVFYQNVVICKFDQNKRSRNFTFVPVYIPWIIW